MDKPQLIDLRRRWHPRGAQWGAETFLPSSDHDDILFSVGLSSLPDLLGKPCLFLLGRPGAGKTSEFLMHLKTRPGESIVTVEARDMDGAGAASIFTGAEWREALDASQPIRLVFDSVDEALIGRPTFLVGLKKELAHAKSSAEKRALSLSLVLTSRLDWRNDTDGQIAELWGLSPEDCTYEIAPLSVESALELARATGVQNPKDFGTEWSRAGMDEYACWPRTLIWLAREFNTGGRISSSLTELQERRCSRQFEDPGRTKRLRDNITPEDVTLWSAAAELLAVAAMATGCPKFVIGRPAGEHEIDVASLATAIGRHPLATNPTLNLEAFQNAMECGDLFASAGQNAWVFQEQSDAEFLAAQRLARLPAEQLAGFFGDESREGWRVVPQLATTAAMAAVRNGDFRDWVLEHDPLVLMRSDFAEVSSAEKTRALNALLTLIAEGNAPAADEEPAHLQTLAFDGLGNELRPWLTDASRSKEARDMALRIAAECAGEQLARDLGKDIWELAAAPDADALSWLAHAVARIGVWWPKERLLAFVNGERLPGRHWGVRGAALIALFDKRRGDERAKLGEVVPFLEPNRTDVFSLYDIFLHHCHEHIDAENLDDACAILAGLDHWLAPLSPASRIRQLTLDTLAAIALLIPDPKALAALTDWWLTPQRRQNYQIPGRAETCSLADVGLDVPEKRRALLAAILADRRAAAQLDFRADDLPCEPADFGWLLDRLAHAVGSEEKLLARLADRWAWQRSLREENLAALDAAFAHSAEFRARLRPAPDGNIHEAMCRAEDEAEQKWAVEAAELRKLSEETQPHDDPNTTLANALDSCARHESKAWWKLLVAVSGEGDRGRGVRMWETTQPSELPDWERIPDAALPDVMRAARDHLLNDPPELPGPNQWDERVEATRHALVLLRESLATDSDLRAAFRPVWVEIILRTLYPSREPLPAVLASLHAIDPVATLDSIRQQIERDWSENRSLLAGQLDPLWSAGLRTIFEEVLARSPLQPDAYMTGITWLARHDLDAAATLALRRCDKEISGESRAGAIGTALLAFPRHWQRVWPLLAADTAEGLECLDAVIGEFHRLGWKETFFSDKADAEFIATLCGWLMKHLPPQTVRDYDERRELESECCQWLIRAGRAELLRRSFEFAGVGDRWWARRAEHLAERQTRVRAWQPWVVNDLVEWLANRGRTRITDNDSLLHMVEASLRRFESRWKEMPPQRLWNLGTARPLREQALSDELKMHLEADLGARVVPRGAGVVVPREAEFFSREKTDLLVQTQLADGGLASVVVEVKMCDHTQVATSMQTQLAERYLCGQNLTHGIYFVGWYSCSAWPPPEKRKPFQKRALTSARRYLEKQAEALSEPPLDLRAIVSPLPIRRPPRRGKERG